LRRAFLIDLNQARSARPPSPKSHAATLGNDGRKDRLI
jgi:hypothetical protein